MTAADRRYKAFISYSHRDERWATWLHRALETYRPPRALVGTRTPMGEVPARLAPVFRDREELPSATDLGAVINAALQGSACQIVICSPHAAASRWVNEEILAFKRLGRSDRIFSLIVGGEPNASDVPGQEPRECFPAALRYKLGDDGELSAERAEPIAADAREGKDGRSHAKLKLIAGLLGVGFDALRRRESVRAQRRLVAIAGASVCGMVVATGLATTAWLSRSEAIRQRERAESEAETARQVSGFIVNLFEVSDPSEALGSTITAREILDRGARRIEYELDAQPAVKATLIDTVGTVYSSLGLYDQAENLLGRGLATRQQLYGADHPVVARSHANLGKVLALKAHYEDAARHYESSIAALRAARQPDPDALAASLYGLAELRTMQADAPGAEKLLREALLLQRRPGAPETLQLAHGLDELGVALAAQARYADAEPTLREALAMFHRLVPGGVHPLLTDCLNNLATFLYEAGRYDEAEQHFDEALQVNLRLLGDRHPVVATSRNNLAFVLQDAGKFARAEEEYRRALGIRLAALGENHPLTAQSLNNLAFLYHDSGRLADALESERRALSIYRATMPADHPDLALAMQNLGTWLVESGDGRHAEPLLREALRINETTLAPDHPELAITRSAWAFYLLRSMQFDAALEQASKAERALTQALGARHWRVAWARSLEGSALAGLRRFDEAEPLLVDAYAALREEKARASQADVAREALVLVYRAARRPLEAERYRALRVDAGLPTR